MSPEQRAIAINAMWEGQELGQFLLQQATTDKDKAIAEALYSSCWCLYQILTSERRKLNNVR